MEHTIASISELNTRGAAALASGHVNLAFESFSSALELLGTFIRHGPAPESLGPIDGSASNSYGCSNGSPVGLTWASALKEAKSAHLQFSGRNPSFSPSAPAPTITTFEHQHFVYKEALVFNPSLVLSPHATMTFLPVCLAMVQFNLGLTYQMKTKDIGEQALIRALTWYDLCLAQVQCSVHAGMPGYMNIVVAAMNNMAIASYDLCHFGKARHIFGTLMEVVSSNSINDRIQNFGEAHMQGLLLNIILLHVDAIAPAA